MPASAASDSLDADRALLWTRVQQLWRLAQARDAAALRDALHPGYSGWESDSPVPHDREHAIAALSGDTSRLERYELFPLGIAIHDGHTGVVHYAYTARLAEAGGPARDVAGRWTEVYVRRDDTWLMAAVAGGAEVP